jgi:cysteine synthase A
VAYGTSDSILDSIGNTPIVRVQRILVKFEFLNPSGSIKARVAKYVVDKAEREGLLLPGDTIVESTSGNTGNAFGLVAAVKGYRMLVVMPKGLSSERSAITRAYGAEIEHVGEFQVTEARLRAQEFGSRDGYFCPAQFDSEWNVEENRLILGPEILSQLQGEGIVPDALVMGVGTGGTLIGVGQAFRDANPDCKLFAVEPEECATISRGEVGDHAIEGIADGFIPSIYERHADMVDEVMTVTSKEATDEMVRLARSGLFVGPSSGANLVAAERVRAYHPELTAIVTLFCDEGEKYIEDHFSPAR